MLNPAYLAEALDKPETEKNVKSKEGSLSNKKGELSNIKLKQCYTASAQLKPFYSGGKISIIESEKFVCQYGTSVNVIKTAKSIKTEEEDENGFKTSFSICKSLEVEMDGIICFDACPASKVLITSHKSNLLRVWCLISGEVVRTVKSLHNMPVGFIEICKTQAFEDMRSALSSMSELKAIEKVRQQLWWITVSGASLKLWQIGGNQMSKLIRIDNITSLGYVKWDGTTFYAAERHIYIIGISSEIGQFGVLKTLEGHYSQVTGIEFTEDEIMLSCGRDKVVIIWDMKMDFNKIKTIPFASSIEGMYLSSPFDMFVAVNPSQIFHFGVKDHKISKRAVLCLNENEIVTGLHTFALAHTLAVEGCLISSHTGTLYEVIKTKEESSKKSTLSVVRQYVGDLDEILCVVLWTDGKVAVANNTNVIKVYDLRTGSCDFLRGHTDLVLSLNCFKEWMVSSSKDNQIIFWRSGSIEPHSILSGHLASVTSVCFNPINETVYSVSEDHFLKVWDKQRLLKGIVAHEKEINSVHCSPNGALIATASRDKTAKIWNADSLQCITSLKGHRKGVWDVKFSAWDQLIATASADTTIKIWNISTHDCLQTLQGHLSSVLQVQFINMGLQVLSVSSDGSMKSWELKTSSCILTEECGGDKIWALDSSPDGNIVVTGSADSVLTLWSDITEEKVTQVMERKKKLVEDEQKLDNLLIAKQWTKAFEFALNLDRPFTLLKIIREAKDMSQFQPVIEKLEDDQLLHLINYLTKWNTNTKTSTEAQILLHIIMRTIPQEQLSRFVQPMLLLSYSEKHHQRIYRMMRQVAFLEFLSNEHGKS